MNVNVKDMKINFRRLELPVSFDGKMGVFDIAETLGNYMMFNGSVIMDIGFEDLAKEIYYSKDEVEIPDKYKAAIKAVVAQAPFIATIKRGVTKMLE